MVAWGKSSSVNWGGDELVELDDVLVVQLLEDFDLADGRDRELRRIKNRKPQSQEHHLGKEKKGRRGGILTPSRSLSMRIFLSATISLVSDS